jgi:hypothetical protein
VQTVASVAVAPGNEDKPPPHVGVLHSDQTDPHRTTVEFFEQIKMDQLRLLVLRCERKAARDRELSERGSLSV